jgi:prolyl-tRNA synthetase
LIGIPLRIVVSAKHLGEGKVEVKERRSGAIHLVALDQVSRALDDLSARQPGAAGSSRG